MSSRIVLENVHNTPFRWFNIGSKVPSLSGGISAGGRETVTQAFGFAFRCSNLKMKIEFGGLFQLLDFSTKC